MDIEKDMKRCEELIKKEHANWIGTSNQLAIAHLIERIKELEVKLEFKKYGDLDNIQFDEYMSQFILEQKVKDKVKELKKELKNSRYPYILEHKINILEELLEGE